MQQNDLLFQAQEQVREMIQNAVAIATKEEQFPEADCPGFTVEIPGDTTHGDFAANIAMVGARVWRMAPPKIAEIIVSHLDFTGSYFEKASIAGPGFINFTLRPAWFADVVTLITEKGEDYGRTPYGNGKKVVVEFVSANPTGPMHLGNARGGVVGDCLASILDFAGYQADREFYLNDAGNQIQRFGASLEARYLQLYKGKDVVDFPEDGYQGEDIIDNAKEFAEKFGDSFVEASSQQRRAALVEYILPRNVELMRSTLEKYRVEYDTWFSETTLHEDGSIDRMVELLKDKNLAYEQDGALWYKATEFGGEQDEVLIRSNGNPTYFAADIAYHYNKFAERGYDIAINLWGSDHHGHVARLKGAMDAIGLRGDALEIILFQFVHLIKDGEPFRMSKRSGQSITLGEFLDMVPVDAVRFFFNMRETGSVIDFDLDLALEESSQNPVYYVQYAHARICSLLKRLEDEGVALREPTQQELELLNTPEEIELIRSIAGFPSLVVGAAKRYETAVLTHYATEIATLFHKFYTACRVFGEEDSLLQARAALCVATQNTLANVLGLMKITAPESM